MYLKVSLTILNYMLLNYMLYNILKKKEKDISVEDFLKGIPILTYIRASDL